jgi:glycosyltransferase involved in cell wall biosynthesis
VVSVHDLSVLKFPQWHPADRVKHHHVHFLRGLSRALHVVVGSEATRRELIDELGCHPDRVTTVYYGIREEFRPQTAEAIAVAKQKLNLPDRYFLCVGTIEPRKNLVTAMKAFVDLPPETRSKCPLILAGPWGWQADAERDFYERIGQPAGVRYLGYTPAELLPALYAGARVLLFPSHYEGFGMPPTEMLACGGAVLSSTADTLMEVLKGHAQFLPTEDVTAWRTAMQTIATDDNALSVLQRGGVEFAARYNWRSTAEQTMGVYARVLGKAPATPEPMPITSTRAAAAA